MPLLKIPSDFVLSLEGFSLFHKKTNGFFVEKIDSYPLLCGYSGDVLKKSILMYGILALLK